MPKKNKNILCKCPFGQWDFFYFFLKDNAYKWMPNRTYVWQNMDDGDGNSLAFVNRGRQWNMVIKNTLSDCAPPLISIAIPHRQI